MATSTTIIPPEGGDIDHTHDDIRGLTDAELSRRNAALDKRIPGDLLTRLEAVGRDLHGAGSALEVLGNAGPGNNDVTRAVPWIGRAVTELAHELDAVIEALYAARAEASHAAD